MKPSFPTHLTRLLSISYISLAALVLSTAASYANGGVACTALTGLGLPDVDIESATDVPVNGLPAHCDVRGTILRGGGNIKFAVFLPPDDGAWNGRFQMVGNGGKAGTISIEAMETALTVGYATTSTDTGHNLVDDGPGAQFGVDREKEIDFGYRAVHETTVTAKTIIAAHYGRYADFSYWTGCSTGGRQGMMETQRYPDDYDGVIIGAPVYDYTGQQMIAPAFMRALYNVDPFAETPLISAAEAMEIGDIIYAQCDAIDGLPDGQIRDPRQCDFDHRLDLGSVNGWAGLTEAQLVALDRIYGGVEVRGKVLVPGRLVGSERMRGGGWRQMLIKFPGAPSPPFPTIHGVIIDSFNWIMFRVDPGADYNYMTDFDFEHDPQKMIPMAKILSATNPNIKKFENRGGKMIMYHGWADLPAAPLNTIAYRDAVIKKVGEERTNNLLKLYMIPGMGHCGGGVGHNQVDYLLALVDWVENGNEPGALVGSKSGGSTRKQCPYPQVAVFNGGDSDDQAHFICQLP